MSTRPCEICSGDERRDAPQRGFVMPAVLFTIAALSIFVWAAARSVDAANDQFARLQDRLRLEQDALTAEARIAYALATQPMSLGRLQIDGKRISPTEALIGLSLDDAAQTSPFDAEDAPTPRDLFLDGRHYGMNIGATSMRVSLQDAAGLFNLNFTDEAELQRLLAGMQMPRGASGRFAGHLLDYIDTDDLERAYGREAAPFSDDRNAPLNDRLPARAGVFFPGAAPDARRGS